MSSSSTAPRQLSIVDPASRTPDPQWEMPRVASRDEWTAARKILLEREKALTRDRDALNAERRALPMVLVDKPYVFETRAGQKTLLELFEGRRQLVVYHFMFRPDRADQCVGCSHMADNTPRLEHMHARDTTVALVSRAPLAEIEAYRGRMGWTVPWHSSWGSDFNYDFHVTLDERVAPIEYNFTSRAELEADGTTFTESVELPGLSVFLRDGDHVHHTYSAYARGLDQLLNTHNWLDLTPFGRGEGWGGMPDLGGQGMNWLRHHDRYL